MTKRRPGAFTLVELLIVMGVLVIVLSILLPAFGRVMAITRRVHCASNLGHIGQAYGARKSDEPLFERSILEVQHWARSLKPYLGGSPLAFVCPEDEDPFTALPDVRVWVRHDDQYRYQLTIFSTYPYWLEQNSWEMSPVPGLWKLNQQEYDALRAQGLPREGHNISDILPRYVPGDNPREYWFIMEDLRSDEVWATGDRDYDDLIIHVTQGATGSVDLMCYRGYTIFTFDLIGPDGTTYYDAGGAIQGPLHFEGVGSLSYGMSWRVERMASSTKKILVVDYEAEICYVGADAPQLGEGWAVEKAPRHLGEVNVLYGSGAVVTLDDDEIDPDIDANDARYWDPLR